MGEWGRQADGEPRQAGPPIGGSGSWASANRAGFRTLTGATVASAHALTHALPHALTLAHALAGVPRLLAGHASAAVLHALTVLHALAVLGAEDLAKQLKYADRLKIPYVAMIGENETKENKVTLKNMASGEQELITPEEILKRIK